MSLRSLIFFFACVAGCASKSGPQPEPLQSSPPLGKGVVVYEFIGEADVAKHEIKIRPALPSEIPSNSLAAKSWSQLSTTGDGGPTPVLNFATYGAMNGPGAASSSGASDPYPASYDCAAGHQCAWISVTQPSGGGLKFGDAVVVIYNFNGGVTIDNGDSLPSSAPLYASALPTPSTYFRYPGGPAWNNYRWGDPAGSSHSRAWDFNLHGSTGYTFRVQVWAVIDRSYSSFSGPTPITSFTDACSAGTSYFSYSAGTGQNKGSQTVALPFPFSLYDSNGGGAVAAVQSLQFHVDGALTLSDDIGVVGNHRDTASIVATGLGKYAILPFYSNFTTASGGGQLCYTSAGTAPSRTGVFTWKGIRFEADPSKAATFSAILHENTDAIDFQFASVIPATTTATAGVRKDDTTYTCMLTGSGCVTDLIASGVSLNMVQYTLSPSDPTYAGP